jgi:hypothetical protein
LSQNKNSREYEEWFLNYKPGYAKNNKTNQNKTQKIERKTQKSSKSRKNRK